MRTKRRMSAIEFAAVRPFLKLSEQRIDAARFALVDGMTRKEIGDSYGWTRQAVQGAISAVWRTFEDWNISQEEFKKASAAIDLPPGWRMVELCAPAQMIDKFLADLAAISPPPPPPQKRKATKKT